MKNLTIIISLLFLLSSCLGNTIYDKPKDLIPKDTMMLLLKDLYLATSSTAVKNKNLHRKISYISLVYDTYKIDSLRFKTSNLYYTSEIDIYEPMLEEILVLLNKEKTFLEESKKVKDSIFQDSIKKVKSEISKKNKKRTSKKNRSSKKSPLNTFFKKDN